MFPISNAQAQSNLAGAVELAAYQAAELGISTEAAGVLAPVASQAIPVVAQVLSPTGAILGTTSVGAGFAPAANTTAIALAGAGLGIGGATAAAVLAYRNKAQDKYCSANPTDAVCGQMGSGCTSSTGPRCQEFINCNSNPNGYGIALWSCQLPGVGQQNFWASENWSPTIAISPRLSWEQWPSGSRSAAIATISQQELTTILNTYNISRETLTNQVTTLVTNSISQNYPKTSYSTNVNNTTNNTTGITNIYPKTSYGVTTTPVSLDLQVRITTPGFNINGIPGPGSIQNFDTTFGTNVVNNVNTYIINNYTFNDVTNTSIAGNTTVNNNNVSPNPYPVPSPIFSPSPSPSSTPTSSPSPTPTEDSQSPGGSCVVVQIGDDKRGTLIPLEQDTFLQSMANMFVSILPQTPQSMRLPTLIANIAGQGSLGGNLALELYTGIWQYLGIIAFIKFYKLIPGKFS